MWMMVLFDLPVVEKKERKDAAKFRNFLLDNGFSMLQFSIYTKVFSGSDACTKYYSLIEKNLPNYGKVDIVTFTDMQYGNIKSYIGKAKTHKKNLSAQLLLF
jgi:CRISPR-associated protein Cas2